MTSPLGVRRPVPLGLPVLAAVLAGVAMAAQPFVTVAVGLGLALLVVTVLHPAAVLGLTLVLGPIDLGFLTGGFKTLLQDLGGLDMNGIRLAAVTASFALLLGASHRETARAAFAPPFRWYTVFLLFAGMTLAYSLSPNDGARLFLKLAYPLLVALVALRIARDEATLERLTDGILIAAVVILAVINPISATLGGYEIEALTGEIRYRGPGIHQNPFAFYCVVVVLLCLARVHTRRQARYLLLGALAFAWLVLTRTRIALAGLIVGVVVLEWFFLRHRRQVWMPLLIAAGAGVGVFVVLPYFLERTFQGAPPSLGALLTTPPSAWLGQINLTGREVLWGLVWTLFAAQPLSGAGLGATSAFLRERSTPGGLVVHNDYLRLAAETGVIGAGLFVLAILALLWFLIRRAGRTPFAQESAATAAAGLGAFLVVAVTDNPLDYYASVTQFLFFFVAASCLTRMPSSRVPVIPPDRADQDEAHREPDRPAE